MKFTNKWNLKGSSQGNDKGGFFGRLFGQKDNRDNGFEFLGSADISGETSLDIEVDELKELIDYAKSVDALNSNTLKSAAKAIPDFIKDIAGVVISADKAYAANGVEKAKFEAEEAKIRRDVEKANKASKREELIEDAKFAFEEAKIRHQGFVAQTKAAKAESKAKK